MQLTEEQKNKVRCWIGEGSTLADLQKLINSEFGLSATFMDVRFLVLDMGLTLKDQQTSSGAVDLSKPPPQAATPDAPADSAATGGVSVSLDRVLKPGAIVSGSVTFSDGVSAEWMLDQMGRLGLSGTAPGYRPGPEDLQAFQEELAQLLQSRGM
ncbi:MAG: hypothetical protein ABR497_09480 [Kiritimatiellia bacterium]|nr:hypothetical protein [Lentisphaerota bacterium]